MARITKAFLDEPCRVCGIVGSGEICPPCAVSECKRLETALAAMTAERDRLRAVVRELREELYPFVTPDYCSSEGPRTAMYRRNYQAETDRLCGEAAKGEGGKE